MKTIMKKIIITALILLSLSAFAANSFIVRQIKIKGLESVSTDTVLSYLPIKVGDTLQTQNTAKVIQALYETGFFSNISLEQDNNTLVLILKERPTISEINITGNKDIPHDKLDEALKKLGLQKGRFFDNATLEQVKQALINQYYAMGRYNAKVEVTQTPQSRNRIAIGITIYEGEVATIRGIEIIGNKHYSSAQLVQALHISVPDFMSFFSHKDEYSADKLQQSLQDIQDFYMNHGYVRIRFNGTQVTVTPDREQVYIIFNLTEGDQYTFSGYALQGDLVGKAVEMKQLIPIIKGAVFSKQQIMNTAQNLTTYLGNLGYAFAKVTPEPKIDDESKTVFINFQIAPDRKYYVRNINFFGNDTTSELALRNQFYQMEGSLYSTTNVQNSLYRLRQNEYIDAVQAPPQITPKKVEGTNNLLDLDVNLTEKLSASFNLSFGYSQAYGFLVSTGITHPNFMGTGKTVGFNVSSSSYQKSLSLSYINPFYTPDGVTRSINIFGTQTSSAQLALAEYATDSYGVNVNYGFPLSVHSSLNLGYGFQHTYLKLGGVSSNMIQSFINNYGTMFDQLLLTGGWSRQTTDLPIMPTKGTIQSLSLTVSTPIDNNPLQYFKLSYTHDWYLPLNDYFIFHTHGIVGYGDGYGSMHGLPFFQNYYAGGLGVQGINRAYSPLSLGPFDSSGNQIGGNFLASGTAELILPKFSNTVRTSIFLDGGNVFQTNASAIGYANNPFNFSFASLRYSYGVQVEWWTPLNLPLYFSVAQPINNVSSNQLDMFQFTIGTLY
jgi:outer membrane protein insertion porin family